MANDMPLKIQNSKFRHVYGQATRKDGCFENIRITKNAHDSMFCAVNPKFMAVVLESIGGGSFLVLPVNQVGRVDINAPKISGHSGPVNDIKWNPFDDHVIASASDDLTIKIWEIPEHGLSSSMPRMLTDLHGHGRRVTYIEWHPTAENVLLSAAFDYRCIVWNVGSGSAMNVISCHTNTIYSISWSPDGALFATSCKDKKIRIIDPRTGCVLQEGKSHAGLKTCKLVFLKDHKLFTTGFSRLGDRELALWDGDNLAEPIYKDSIDYSSGVLLPYYDSDLGVIYLAGKGDGNIRYYEIVDRNVVYLNQYPSSDPQRSLGMMPKRALDCTKCEIARFYKLHTNKALIEPLPMIVPRRSDEFQEDIYPPSSAGVPACTAEEWASGVDRKPVTLSMMELAERSKGQTRVGSLRTQKAQLLRTQVVAPVKVEKPPPTTAPASLQNIYKLSSNSSLNLSATSRPTARMHQPAKAAAPQHMNSSGNSSSDASPAQVSSFTSFSFNQSANENQRPKQTSPQRQPITARPASPTKVATPPSNSQPIKQAHIRPSIVQPVAHRSSPESSPEPPRILPSQIASQQNGSNQPSRWRNNSAWQKPAAPIAQPSERPISFNQSGRNNRPRQSNVDDAPESNGLYQTPLSSTPQISSNPSPLDPGPTQPGLQVPGASSKNNQHSLSPYPEAAASESLVYHSLSPRPLDKPVSPNMNRKFKQVQKNGEIVKTPPRSPQPIRREQHEDSPEMPGAYRYAMSTFSPINPNMSEVERKKRLKQQKKRISRSSSTSRVEELRDSSPVDDSDCGTMSDTTNRAMQRDSRESSEEWVDERRKQLIAKKVEELKRIRDLAKAYAEGVNTKPRPKSMGPISTDQREPILTNSKSARVETAPLQSPVKDIPTAAVQPSWLHEDDLYKGVMKDLKYPDGKSLFTKMSERKSNQTSSCGETVVRTADENLPKFPLQSSNGRSVRDSTNTIYDNLKARASATPDRYDLPVEAQAEDKISAPVAPHMIREQDNVQKVKPSDPSQSLPNNELHKAYFKQCEEIKLLRVQNSEKDKKIDALERELVQLKKMIITL